MLLKMRRKSAKELDDDCWEIIFSRLSICRYPHDIASVSLVCKTFLSMTNQLKQDLRVSNLTAPILPKLLQRFRQLKSINITMNPDEDCNDVILQIAQSRLEHLEALKVSYSEIFPRAGLQVLGRNMKGLKILDFAEFCSCCDDDLIGLADWFPFLEEVSISGYALIDCKAITDRGVEVLTSKLKGLKKINLGHCREITDHSLMSISNCANLTYFVVSVCPLLTESGIGYLLRNSSKLTTLAFCLSAQSLSAIGDQFTMENSFPYARNLEVIKIWDMAIPDGLLCSIAKSCPRIKKIFLNPSSETHNFTMEGLTMLLKTCSSLRDLSLRLPWLRDECIVEVREHIRGLTHIDLGNCPTLSTSTFFTLIRNCPLLETIEMNQTSIGTYEDSDVDLHRNHKVKELRIGMNALMNDRTLLRIVSACPNLEYLCMRSCASQDVTNDGIAKCLDICPQLLHLDVSDLDVSNFVGPNQEPILKLKSIYASYTLIDDEALEMIGKKCPDLVNLAIEGCDSVTNHGLELLVSKCEKLETINIDNCENVSVDLLDLLVKMRPSLKVIITPCGFVPSEDQRDQFLRNGCLLISTDNLDEEYVDGDLQDDEVEA